MLITPRAFLGQTSIVVAAVLWGGCSEGPTPPVHAGPAASLRVVSPREIVDTIGVTLNQPLAVLVVDSAHRAVPGAPVDFQSPGPLEGVAYTGPPVLVGGAPDRTYTTQYTGVTDSGGIARAYMRIAFAAGVVVVRAQISEIGATDSVVVTVRPGAPARVTLDPADTAVYVGATYPLLVRAYDRGGNTPLEPIALTARRPSVATLGPDDVIRANATGRTYATASVGSVHDSAGVSVVPRASILAFTHRSGSGDTAAFFSFDLDGSRYRVINSTPFAFNNRAQYFFPSGDRVAYHDRVEGDPSFALRLFTMDLEGNVATLLPPGGQVVEATTPQPSRDGTWVYFTAITGYQTAEVWRVSPDGAGSARVGPASIQGDRYLGPSPSPDGSRLAVTIDRTDLSQGVSLGIVDVASGTAQVIRPLSAGRPRWSPAASEIAHFGDGGIWIVSPDGDPLLGPIAPGSAPTVAWDTWDGQIDWSPDGRWLLACVTGRFAGDRSLVVIDRLSGELLPLAYTAQDRLCGATWRP